jgi:hypothetical protein
MYWGNPATLIKEDVKHMFIVNLFSGLAVLDPSWVRASENAVRAAARLSYNSARSAERAFISARKAGVFPTPKSGASILAAAAAEWGVRETDRGMDAAVGLVTEPMPFGAWVSFFGWAPKKRVPVDSGGRWCPEGQGWVELLPTEWEEVQDGPAYHSDPRAVAEAFVGTDTARTKEAAVSFCRWVRKIQVREGITGSCYNSNLQDLAKAWSWGIEASWTQGWVKEAKAADAKGHRREANETADKARQFWEFVGGREICPSRRTLRALVRLSNKGVALHGARIAELKNSEIHRLSKLSGAFLRWVNNTYWEDALLMEEESGWCLNFWKYCNMKLQDWKEVGSSASFFRKGGIPAEYWWASPKKAFQYSREPEAFFKAYPGSERQDLLRALSWWLLGRKPAPGLRLEHLQDCPSRQGVEELLEWAGESEELILPAIQLLRLYRKASVVKALFKRGDLDPDSAPQQWLHGAGQFQLPRKAGSWDKKGWGDLARRFGEEVLAYGRVWDQVEELLGRVPRSLAELRAVPLRGAGVLGLLAERYNLDSGDVEEYQELLEQATEGPLPVGVLATEGEYTLEVLHHQDPQGPMLGLETDCCQHLGNAGRKCAKHGVRSPLGGFVVVRHRHNIVAMSWFWALSEQKGLCFDNIETKGSLEDRASKLVPLYSAAAQALVAQGWKKVTVGQSYVTFDTGWATASRPLYPEDYSSYRDSHSQWLLAKKPQNTAD